MRFVYKKHPNGIQKFQYRKAIYQQNQRSQFSKNWRHRRYPVNLINLGARPRPRVRERNYCYNRDKSPEFLANAQRIQQAAFSQKNPAHLTDAKFIEYRQNLTNRHVNQGYIQQHLQNNKSLGQGVSQSQNVNQYQDSLEQLQQDINPGKALSRHTDPSVHSQQRSSRLSQSDSDQAILMKKDYANFYGVDDDSTKQFVYKNIDSNAIKSAPIKKEPESNLNMKNQERDRNIFVKEKARVNPAFNHHKNLFFNEGGSPSKKDQKDQFVNNYNEFYRGSTPTGNRNLDNPDPMNIRKSYDIVNKKKDIYAYNILSNKKNYLYSVDQNRLDNANFGNHYQKWANN